MNITRYYLALDLVDNQQLIEEYDQWHKTGNGWPEIRASILDAGIINMEIYRVANRLFMVMETDETFDFSKKAEMDKNNPRVQEWEHLMSKYQQRFPWAKEGEKWVLLNKIFQL